MKSPEWKPRYDGRCLAPAETNVEDKFRALLFIVALLLATVIVTLIVHRDDQHDQHGQQPVAQQTNAQ